MIAGWWIPLYSVVLIAMWEVGKALGRWHIRRR